MLRFLRTTVLAFGCGLLLGVGVVRGAAVLGSTIFSDIPAGASYDAAVGELYAAGILGKSANNLFRPDEPVTRGDLALLLHNVWKASGGKKLRRGAVALQSPPSPPTSSVSISSTSSVSTERVTDVSAAREAAQAFSRNANGTLRFTAGAYTVPENVATKMALLSVVRAGGNRGSVTVEYAVDGVTATPGNDLPATTGMLTFGDGETSKTFSIPVTDDTVAEGKETATVVLRNPTGGANLGTPSTASLNIVDDESSGSESATVIQAATPVTPTIGFSAMGYAVAENGGTISITVARSGPLTAATSVAYLTKNGSAVSGTDYTATNGKLNFVAGEANKTFTVAVLNDSAIDGNKTLALELQNPTGGAVLGTATAQLTIADDEAATFGTGALKFSKSSYGTSEGETLLLTVLRIGGAQSQIAVNYATGGGSASAGQDFAAIAGTLTFLSGEASKTIAIPILRDTQSDAEETFTVNLTVPSGTPPSILDVPNSALVTIYE